MDNLHSYSEHLCSQQLKGGNNCPLTDERIHRMLYRPIILFCLKKELNSDTCYNMDEPCRYCATGHKPHTHKNDKHCMIPLNRGTYNSQIHREKKNSAE